jgi:hypothetical protein
LAELHLLMPNLKLRLVLELELELQVARENHL